MPILAAADIGSNTAHLLIGDVSNGQVTRISDTNEWLSLGQKVRKTGAIPDADVALLKKTLTAFGRLSHLHRAERLYIFATEAVRKAANSAEVIAELEQQGTPVEIIKGRREAELGLRGAWSEVAEYGGRQQVMVEVGGGSAQIAYLTDGLIDEEFSLPLGTGTLIAEVGLEQPPTETAVSQLSESIQRTLATIPKRSLPVFGVGGVARGLWRALHPDGNQLLDLQEIDYLAWATGRLTDNEIAARFNVKLRRASTLLPGAHVYGNILRCLEQSQMQVSRFGVREGALLEMADGKIQGWRI